MSSPVDISCRRVAVASKDTEKAAGAVDTGSGMASPPYLAGRAKRACSLSRMSRPGRAGAKTR